MESRGLLLEAQRRVGDHMRDLALAGFPVSICYADEHAGTLVAGIPRLRPGLAGRYRVLLGELISDTPVRFLRCGLARRQIAKQNHHRPMVGGISITQRLDDTHYELGSICLAAARGGGSGLVTAGHVAEAAGRVCYQPRRHDPPDTWAAGTVAVVSNYLGVAETDSAFLDVAPGQTLTQNSIWKSTTERYTVTGTVTPALGDEVSMQGAARAAERHGQICATSASVTFMDTGTLNNQYLARYASHDGDSGAPVYVKDAGLNVRLVGLNVGIAAPEDVHPPVGHGYPPVNGHYAIISKWARIEAELGVIR
jgi:hypothetical protein